MVLAVPTSKTVLHPWSQDKLPSRAESVHFPYENTGFISGRKTLNFLAIELPGRAITSDRPITVPNLHSPSEVGIVSHHLPDASLVAPRVLLGRRVSSVLLLLGVVTEVANLPAEIQVRQARGKFLRETVITGPCHHTAICANIGNPLVTKNAFKGEVCTCRQKTCGPGGRRA